MTKPTSRLSRGLSLIALLVLALAASSATAARDLKGPR
jgi:hypothetical protein